MIASKRKTASEISTMKRMQSEQKLLENEHFFVVADADPIVRGHLLVLSKEQKPSFSDCNPEMLVSLLEEGFLRDAAGVDYYLIERGRARFCSSFDNLVHAHAHLVPASAIGTLAPAFSQISCHQSLLDALHALRGRGEYLLWGKLAAPFFDVEPLRDVEKRFIRNMLLGLTLQMQ